jgi:protein N-terminal methyltransferase
VAIGNNQTFWKAVKAGTKDANGKPLWYKKGIDYWDGQDATYDGMLGGYAHVSVKDAEENTAFLESLMGDELEAGLTSVVTY